ncbi:cell division protein SepF [Candidatus Micrarchaeota archaeon]|nr:cell division protein SepF [Candidatus Micrarchaeota archaeon]
MGFFDKLLGGKNSSDNVEVPDLEEVMQSEGDAVSPPADFYVKRIDLRNEGDADIAMGELGKKNIIILNMTPISKQPNRLKSIIAKLRANSAKLNGDLAVLPPDMLLLTPGNVKIVKSKPKPTKQMLE